MEFRLAFKCDNAAFEADMAEEIANILKRLAIHIECNDASTSGTIRDGNREEAGKWELVGKVTT